MASGKPGAVQIVGHAYAFKTGCPAASYVVIGQDLGNRTVLRGPAPRRSPSSCAVVGYSASSPHAQSLLIYSTTHH